MSVEQAPVWQVSSIGKQYPFPSPASLRWAGTPEPLDKIRKKDGSTHTGSCNSQSPLHQAKLRILWLEVTQRLLRPYLSHQLTMPKKRPMICLRFSHLKRGYWDYTLLKQAQEKPTPDGLGHQKYTTLHKCEFTLGSSDLSVCDNIPMVAYHLLQSGWVCGV